MDGILANGGGNKAAPIPNAQSKKHFVIVLGMKCTRCGRTAPSEKVRNCWRCNAVQCRVLVLDI